MTMITDHRLSMLLNLQRSNLIVVGVPNENYFQNSTAVGNNASLKLHSLHEMGILVYTLSSTEILILNTMVFFDDEKPNPMRAQLSNLVAKFLFDQFSVDRYVLIKSLFIFMTLNLVLLLLLIPNIFQTYQISR